MKEIQRKYFTSPFINTFVDYKGCVLPSMFEDIQNKIYNMEVREEDIWVMSFPKSGNYF